ncbi:hypothetical protein COB55_03295 [Candidatus Wolfebacteria bacterium]|nr:MAG: hypothetical protein COB55_03295 [Candidatus Wolfebacteria bacterium]
MSREFTEVWPGKIIRSSEIREVLMKESEDNETDIRYRIDITLYKSQYDLKHSKYYREEVECKLQYDLILKRLNER